MSENDFNTEGLRTFIGIDGESKYYINTPTAEDIRTADWEYSKAYTKSLVEGITTTAEMTDILMRRGIIGPEFEQRSNELAEILNKKIEALEVARNTEEKKELAVEVANARDELFQWNQRLQAPLANTCEQIADDTRLECLTSNIIVDADGNKVWENFEAYLTEKEQGLAQKARFEVMLYLQGLESDFMDKTPEALVMKELEKEATEEVLAEIAKESEVDVDIETKVDNKKVTKKTPTKKITKQTSTRKTTKRPRSKRAVKK